MIAFFCLSVLFAVPFAPGRTAEAQNEAKGRIKALWVVRDILKSKVMMDRLAGDASMGGFTDVFVQVRGRGDAYYKSRIVPMAEGLDTTYDPLAYLIPKLKSRNIRIHAWVNVFYIWSADKDPSDTNHIVHTNPDWSAVSGSNESMVEVGTTRLRARDVEGIFFSPSSDEYRRHFLSLIHELATTYDLDGIHLDYVRYPGNDYDYSESSRAKFMLRYHIDPLEGYPTSDWVRSRWDDFRREEVTEVVRSVGETIRSVKPGFVLSAAVFADLTAARDRVLQDWPRWLREGIIDLAVPMNYATDMATFDDRIAGMRSELGDSLFSRRVVMGVALYNQNAADAAKKAARVLQMVPAGASYFSYEVLRTNRGYFDAIAKLK